MNAHSLGVVHKDRHGMPRPAAQARQREDPPASPVIVSILAARRFQVAAWRRGGMAVAARPIRRARAALCRACGHFWPQGDMITGFCALPTSCCRNKPALAGSRCPLSEPHWAAFPEPGRAGATPVHASGNPRQIGPIS